MEDIGRVYYVYVHVREDTGEIFYVGKGHGRRAGTKWGRNKWWNRISKKTSWRYELCQSEMGEEDAMLLEMWLIAKYRSEGVILCNISEGGEGQRSPVYSLRKPVNCSNGMRFSKLTDAESYMGISRRNISLAASGKYKQAGGYTWWWDGESPKEYECPRERIAKANMKEVMRSDGKLYKSLNDAAESVGGSVGNISIAARSDGLIRYGFTWRYL